MGCVLLGRVMFLCVCVGCVGLGCHRTGQMMLVFVILGYVELGSCLSLD